MKVKKALLWMLVAWGVFVGIFCLTMLAVRDVPTDYMTFGKSLSARWTTWFQLLTATLYAAVSLTAAVVGQRNPKRASQWLIFSSPFGFVVTFAAFPTFDPGGYHWGSSLVADGVAIPLVFLVPGYLWSIAHRYHWPPLCGAPASFRKRVISIALATCGVFLIVSVWSLYLAVRRPRIGDCSGTAPPSAHQKYFRDTRFVARIVHRDKWFGDVAIVQQHFWGLPWTDRKIVFLSAIVPPGETYFVSAERDYGLLTRWFGVVSLYSCGRFRRLEDAATDLRVIHDGPKDGVRVIGRVEVQRPNAAPGFVDPVPGVQVVVSGKNGRTVLTTDAGGIYDVTGLPAGHYDIGILSHRNPDTLYPNCERWGEDPVSGDIRGCDMTIKK